jgi:hypothetical protein
MVFLYMLCYVVLAAGRLCLGAVSFISCFKTKLMYVFRTHISVILCLWAVGRLEEKATKEASILCRILQVDEIYVKSSFMNDFIKGVQMLHTLNMMRYMYVWKQSFCEWLCKCMWRVLLWMIVSRTTKLMSINLQITFVLVLIIFITIISNKWSNWQLVVKCKI